jgi:O-antigen/teichoic acid export membrane protein
MSRSKAFLNAALFSYLYQAAVMLVGLWLTPFYVRVLGTRDYGVWLVGLQILTFLLLADLGILALVPRDVAQLHGRELSGPPTNSMAVLVAQTARVVLCQTALVGAAALFLFFRQVRGVSSLQGPIAMVLVVFVLTYPLRLFPAVLTGLQDLKFLGQTRMWLWGLSTVAAVALLLLGARFYALACAWCLQELGTDLVGYFRLRRIRPDFTDLKTWRLAGPLEWRWFTRGFWVSLGTISVWLTGGADVLVIAHLLGPAVVVVCTCTSKLVSVLQNQPQILAGLALPGLSQMKTNATRERTLKATVCLTQAMLFVGGAIFVVVLALNRDFVRIWMGSKFYGGAVLSILVVLNFLIRLIAYTLTLALFAFGYEKLSALRFLSDGVVSIVLAYTLVHWLGLAGTAAGFLAGALLIGIPFDMYLLSRELGVSPLQIVRPYVPYLVRSGVVGVAAMLIVQRFDIPNFLILGIVSVAIIALYLIVTVPLVLATELGDYVRTALAELQARKPVRMLGWLLNS